jgi:hypothetical protein
MFWFDDLMWKSEALDSVIKELWINISTIIEYLQVDVEKYNECKKKVEIAYDLAIAKQKEEFDAKKKELWYDKLWRMWDLMMWTKMNQKNIPQE